MHIEILRTARRFHIQPEIAQCFIDAGLAREVVREQLAAPAPQGWTYFCGVTLGGYIAIQRQKGNEVQCLSAKPENVKKLWPDCPDEVIREYTSQPPGMRVQEF